MSTHARGETSVEWNARQLKVHMTPLDRLLLDDLQVAAGLCSHADVLRLALQNLCDHYGLDRKGRGFKFRHRRDTRKASAA